jgi:hypothetical protein
MTKEEKAKLEKLERMKQEYLRNNKDYEISTLYMGGIYSLLSIVFLWWNEVEDYIKVADINDYPFRKYWKESQKWLDKLEEKMREYVDNWDSMNNEFSQLEPVLREFIFGADTPELKAKHAEAKIKDFIDLFKKTQKQQYYEKNNN